MWKMYHNEGFEAPYMGKLKPATGLFYSANGADFGCVSGLLLCTCKAFDFKGP